CVVIVLILGVAVWGGDAVLPDNQLSVQQTDRPQAAPSVTTAKEADHGPPLINQLPGITSRDRDKGDFFGVKPVESEFAGVSKANQPAETAAGKGDKGEKGTTAELSASKEKTKAAPHAVRPYTVKAGDTIEGIAEAMLGSKKHAD